MNESEDPAIRASSEFTRSGDNPSGDDAWIESILQVRSPMPAEVWERLSLALTAEQALRQVRESGESGATVTQLADRRRRPRVLVGVAAAAVVLITVGVVGSMAQDSSGGSEVITATDASVNAPAVLDGAQQDAVVSSEVMAPARQVVSSGIDYGPDTMSGDIQQVVDTMGASTARLMADIQPDASLTEGSSGFTSTLPLLRSCLTWLTGSSDIQALFVDRSTYEGTPAVVVAVPTSRKGSLLAALDVWIVSLDCAQEQSSILGRDQVSLALE